MRFIQIDTKHDGSIAINTDAVTSVKKGSGIVYIYLSEGKAIATQFTNIQNAVDYIQRAQSISLTQGE
jgi:hypothetical protein